MVSERATTILFFNEIWSPSILDTEGCASRCTVTHEPARLDEADVVVFHIPTLSLLPPRSRHRRQWWVALSQESEANYPLLADPMFMAQFDLTMTYRQDADVWTPYFGPETLQTLLTPPVPKTETAPAVFFASGDVDRSGRAEYVRALMEHLPVDSYGRILKNRDLTVDDGVETKLRTIARYKFTLAFENSIGTDYVTEKLFQPLIVGSVPVYLGSPNVDDLAPADHCYVDVRDFAGPAELAAFLLALAHDEDRYNRYLAWKRTGLRDRFVAMASFLRTPALCRLCALIR
jgi:hypothetical protein